MVEIEVDVSYKGRVVNGVLCGGWRRRERELWEVGDLKLFWQLFNRLASKKQSTELFLWDFIFMERFSKHDWGDQREHGFACPEQGAKCTRRLGSE